ncbi:VirB8/TrbF family protein [Azohydromonas lata]|uniref:VirB8/TrbF family protein n=1 Tax=Azohydromonas lata TaxID=45677 RepID=UPI001471006F|nr:VirB8/TrbF family protein [Azohydromonas lata]
MSATTMKARASVALSRFKYLFIKRPDTETANPYLNAARTWNLHVGSVIFSRFMWQMMALLAMLIALAAVGGVVKIGSMSKFTPFVYGVDRNSQPYALGAADAVAQGSDLVIQAEVRRFFEDMRLVTPDAAVQRKAVDRVYSKMTGSDAITAKVNAWFQANQPFQRAQDFVVSSEDFSVLRLSKETLQIDWTEVTYDRKGVPTGPKVKYRASATYYVVEPTPETKREEMELNPARIFIRDANWTEIK